MLVSDLLVLLVSVMVIFVPAMAPAQVGGSYSFSGTTTTASGPSAAEVPGAWAGSEDLSVPTPEGAFTGTGTLQGQPITETGQVNGSNVIIYINGFNLGALQTTIVLQGTITGPGHMSGTMFGGAADGTNWQATWFKDDGGGPTCVPFASVGDCVCKLFDLEGTFQTPPEERILTISLSPGPPGIKPYSVELLAAPHPILIDGAYTSVSGTIMCGQSIPIRLVATPDVTWGTTTVTVIIDGTPIILFVHTFVLVPSITIGTFPTLDPKPLKKGEKSEVDVKDDETISHFSKVSTNVDIRSKSIGDGKSSSPRMIVTSNNFVASFEIGAAGHESCLPGDVVKATVTVDEILQNLQMSAPGGSQAGHEVDYSGGPGLPSQHPPTFFVPNEPGVAGAAFNDGPISTLAGVPLTSTITEWPVNVVFDLGTVKYTESASSTHGSCQSSLTGAHVTVSVTPECP